QRHLELVFEIRDRPQTAYEHARAPAPRVFDQQPVEGVDLDVRVLAEDLADDRDALVGGKQRVLLGVHQDGDEDPLEQVRAAEDDVDVTVGQRVEGPGKN